MINIEIDVNAPIVPFEGLGGIKLYSTKDSLINILSLTDIREKILWSDIAREYNIQNKIALQFLHANNKLFKIVALPEYKGKIFGKIGIGMTETELLEAEPSFVYDDFEEVWVSNKGIFIEMDPETNTVMWISVYIPELETEDFKKGEW